jgi:ATP-binding cassette subfamily B protein
MFKLLFKSIREYKKPSVLSGLFISLEVACEIAIPYIILPLVDNIQYNMVGDSMDISGIYTTLKYGGILLALALLSLCFGTLAAKEAAIGSTGFVKNLRHDLFYKINSFSFSNIDKFSSSSLVTRMTTDLQFIQMAYAMFIRIGVRGPLMLIFSIIASFTINVKLSLIFTVLVPFLGGVLIMVAAFAHPIFKSVFQKYDKMNERVEENVKGIRVVKTYVREDYEKEKFDKSSDEITKNFIKAEKILAWNTPAMQFSIHTAIVFVLILGSYIVATTNHLGDDGNILWEGSLTTGGLTSLLTYSIQSLNSLMMITQVGVLFVISLTSIQRVSEVLREESSIVDPKNPIKEVKDGSIVFSGVNFKYSDKAERYALKGVNLSIKSGEVIGIIGGTGSSKTTLVNLIDRLYDVSTGEVLVAGHDVRDYDLKTLRDSVAVVLQKNVLFSGSIKENMRWGNEGASDEEIIEACKLAQADEFIERMPDKYDSYIEQGGSNVSGGQRQRLCIARALLKKPKVLILDDSTSAVDTKTDSLIRKGLKEYLPSCTKIIIAQRVASIEEADQIFVMDDGEIVARGNSEELKESSPIYREIYDLQNRK